MSRNWSKFDEKALAKFVIPEARRWIRLDINRADLLARPDGRKRIVEAIYTELRQRNIRYAPEQYQPELAVQTIRSPSDILDTPGEGTCLDLAALFAGLCLGYELLPVVVVTEVHALCLVSLTHGAPEWNDLMRADRQTFENLVTNPEDLISLVDTGAFLAVECTGFARSETLPADSIEGAGRQDGYLTFLRAIEAGRRQLDRPDSPLRFAFDAAVAQYHWKIQPPAIGVDAAIATEELVASQVAAGFRLEKAKRADAIRPYPRPVDPLLRQAVGFVDRRAEVASALDGAGGGISWLTGTEGVGKTALLRRLGHEDRPSDYTDGVVYLSEVHHATDGAQQVLDSFFETGESFKPSRARIGRSIKNLNALVMVDGVGAEVVENIADLMPAAGFVATSDAPGSGSIVPLKGLSAEDAVKVFVYHLGREISVEEQPQVEELCEFLGGHPARVIDAARTLASGASTLEVLLVESSASEAGASRVRYSALDEDQRLVVDLTQFFGNSGVLGVHLEEMVPGDTETALSGLVSERVVETSSPRYRLAATWMGEVVDGPKLDEARNLAFRHFEEFAHRASPEEAAASLPEILVVMRSAIHQHRWTLVSALGAAAEGAAALTRQWGLWGTILESALDAAVHSGDQAAHAYALHQLGTRARLLGDKKAARSYLKQARRMRRSIGDTEGAQLTSHNLGFAKLALLPWVVGTVVAVGVGVGVVCGTTDACNTAPPPPTQTVVVEVTPTEIDFEQVSVGSGGRSEKVTIDNVGGGPVNIRAAVIEGDPTFILAAGGCPRVLEPGGSCSYTVSFAPSQPGPFAADFIVEIGDADLLLVALLGFALEPAEVTIDPGVGDFDILPVGGEHTISFTLSNSGQEPTQVTALSVEGNFFSLTGTTCGDSLGPGESCFVDISFRPDRDQAEGVDDRAHDGLLVLNTEVTGRIEVPLAAGSSFFLPDLTVELHEATPIERTQIDGGPDVVVIRVEATIRNGGSGDATRFEVKAERFVERWSLVSITDDPTYIASGVFVGGIPSGDEISLTGFVLIPRAFLEARQSLLLRLVVDSCVGEEFAPEECDVLESNDENNASVEVEANGVVGLTEVVLEQQPFTLASMDTNSANLVTDALLHYAITVAEQQGQPAPIAAIIDSRSLIPPGADPDLIFPGEFIITAGDLRALHMVDLAPSGRHVFVETAAAGTLGAAFEAGAALPPSEEFLHVSDGSSYSYCDAGDRTGLDDLWLGGERVVGNGVVRDVGILPLAVSDYFAPNLGLSGDGSGPTLAEMLQVYIQEALGTVVRSEQYPSGGAARYSRGACFD